MVNTNPFNQTITTAVKNVGEIKLSTLTVAVMLVLSQNALATPISVQGVATSENAVSIGSNSYATAIDSVATGQGSIATGQGFSREDFAEKANQLKSLSADKDNKQKELDEIDTKLEVNDKAKASLSKQIDDLSQLVNSKDQKSEQLDKLNKSLDLKNDELAKEQQNLDKANQLIPNEYLIGENKNISIDFTPILNSLDYNKLNEQDGRNILAQELKTKLETDFVDIQGMFTNKQYLDVLNEFISKRSSYDAFRSVYDAEMGNNKYKNVSVDTINTGEALENVYLRHGQSISTFNVEDVYARLENDKGNHTYSNFQENSYLSDKNYSPDYWEKYSSMLNNLYDQLIVSHLVADKNSNTAFIANQYTNGGCNSSGGSSNDCENKKLNYVFRLAPLNTTYNENNKFKFISKSVSEESVDRVQDRGIKAVVYRIVNDKALSNKDLDFIKHYYDQFNLYANNIDYDSNKWLVDKDHYRDNLQKVLDFNAKLEEYRQLSVQIREAALNDSVKDSLLAQQINLKKEIEALNIDSSFFENMSVSFTDAGKTEIQQGINYIVKQENFIDKNLRYYDGKNVLITTVQQKVKDIQKQISDAENAVKNKQKEIDKIKNQIDDLALTPDEKAATDLKAEKEKELADKEAEKERLEADKKQKEDELNKLNEQLANSSLKDLGLRSQAHGSNAFASGDDSIAIGTNSTVTSNGGIAIGKGSTVTGENAIAMGVENTVLGTAAIAIGQNNIILSDKAIAIGNRIVDDGTNAHSVAIGNESAFAKANPTSSITIQGVEYQFAGKTPTSTISVGANGAERQITHVAAGRVSDTSTDAINGSQLYAVVKALEDVPTTQDISDVITANVNITAGDNINIERAGNHFTISAIDTNTQSVVKAGNGVEVEVANNALGTKDYTVSAKLGKGLSFDERGVIQANETKIYAGENVEVTGDATDGYTITAKTQIINGGKATVVHAGDNVQVTGDVDNGFTVSVKNMRTTVTGGDGAEVISSDNADGSKNYTVSTKISGGLAFDELGRIINNTVIHAGDNVKVTGNGVDGFTISATDTNTQATVSSESGISVTESNNANGTKNYAISAKLGKGLKIDDNGAIAATAQPIKGGDGVTVTVGADEAQTVNVVGVTTTTDDGKSHTRSDLTKSVGVKGDRKNIRTTTAENGDVQVSMSDDIQVHSVSIHNGPNITQNGINANNTRVTNVHDGISPTDAVNVRQLNQQGNVLNQRIDNLANNVKKNQKRADAGIAATAAMNNIPQVMLAGKSGVGVGVGNRGGQTAVAVGYSRASDNAKHIIKLSAGVDTQSKATFGAGYMYQW